MRDEAGAAILEFALVLPVLLILLTGVFEVGRALYISLAVEIALQGGARALARIADPTCPGPCSAGVGQALRRVSDQIVAETGIRRDNVRLTLVPDPAPGTIALRGEVGLTLRLFGAANGPSVWTIAVVRQEQRIGD